MRFTAEQIDQLESDLGYAVRAAGVFADKAAQKRLSDLTSLMAEVRHFAHCVEYGGSVTEALTRWLALFETDQN